MKDFGKSAGNVIGTFLIAVLILVCLAAFSPTLRVLGSLTIAPWSDATPYVSGMWNGIGGAISKTLPQLTAPTAAPAPAPAAPAIPAAPAGSATHCPDGGLRGETFPDRENGVEGLRHRDAVTCKYSFTPPPGAAPAPAAPAIPAAPAAPAPVAQARQVAAAPAAQGCPPAKENTYTSNTDVTVSGPAIVHPWWNTGVPSFGQAQVRTKVEAGQTVTFVGMQGKSWVYAQNPACAANLDKELANASFPVKTVAELKAEDLAQ